MHPSAWRKRCDECRREMRCSVIDARPVDQGSDSDDGSSSIGPTSDVEAAGTTAVTNSPTVISATAARLAARQRAKDQAEKEQNDASERLESVEFCSSIKELSVRVEEVQIPTVVQPAGVRGPAVVVMQTSALKIAPKRPAEEDEMDEAATKNNCYLCSLNGRALTECCILGSEPREYLNGHSRDRSHLVCKWFEEKYKEGSAERAAKVKEAAKVRGYALKRFSMRKKKMRSTN